MSEKSQGKVVKVLGRRRATYISIGVSEDGRVFIEVREKEDDPEPMIYMVFSPKEAREWANGLLTDADAAQALDAEYSHQ